MAGLNGDVTVKGIPANISMSFGDVMNDFKFGGQVHMEARKEKWGLFLDATYMSLGTDIDGARYRTGPDGIVHVEKYLDASINMDEWLVEFGGSGRACQGSHWTESRRNDACLTCSLVVVTGISTPTLM